MARESKIQNFGFDTIFWSQARKLRERSAVHRFGSSCFILRLWKGQSWPTWLRLP